MHARTDMRCAPQGARPGWPHRRRIDIAWRTHMPILMLNAYADTHAFTFFLPPSINQATSHLPLPPCLLSSSSSLSPIPQNEEAADARDDCEMLPCDDEVAIEAGRHASLAYGMNGASRSSSPASCARCCEKLTAAELTTAFHNTEWSVCILDGVASPPRPPRIGGLGEQLRIVGESVERLGQPQHLLVGRLVCAVGRVQKLRPVAGEADARDEHAEVVGRPAEADGLRRLAEHAVAPVEELQPDREELGCRSARNRLERRLVEGRRLRGELDGRDRDVEPETPLLEVLARLAEIRFVDPRVALEDDDALHRQDLERVLLERVQDALLLARPRSRRSAAAGLSSLAGIVGRDWHNLRSEAEEVRLDGVVLAVREVERGDRVLAHGDGDVDVDRGEVGDGLVRHVVGPARRLVRLLQVGLQEGHQLPIAHLFELRVAILDARILENGGGVVGVRGEVHEHQDVDLALAIAVAREQLVERRVLGRDGLDPEALDGLVQRLVARADVLVRLLAERLRRREEGAGHARRFLLAQPLERCRVDRGLLVLHAFLLLARALLHLGDLRHSVLLGRLNAEVDHLGHLPLG
eukprot:7389790-Prymnesium_polylepis.1